MQLFKAISRQINWRVTALVIVLLPLLTGLGLWQLQRADEKRQLLLHYQQQQAKEAIDIEHVNSLSQIDSSTQVTTTYRRVFMSGYFDTERYWLLDNRSRDGRMGYEVVMPFVGDDITLLVNRGWVAANQDRSQLPTLETPSGQVVVEGTLYEPQKNAIFSSVESDWVLPWPKRVLQLDIVQAEQSLNLSLYPTLLRINKELTQQRNNHIDDKANIGLVTQWVVVNMKADKHDGYALQWFTMAVALLFFYVWMLIKAVNESL